MMDSTEPTASGVHRDRERDAAYRLLLRLAVGRVLDGARPLTELAVRNYRDEAAPRGRAKCRDFRLSHSAVRQPPSSHQRAVRRRRGLAPPR